MRIEYQKQPQSMDVDELLEKIRKEGVGSLTSEEKNFLDSYILFKNGIIIFDENIKNDSVIIILEGCINVEGVYINQGSILRCYKIMNKNIIYIDDNFKYLIYNNI